MAAIVHTALDRRASRRRSLTVGARAVGLGVVAGIAAACGSYGDTSVPGGYAFPKQRPSSDDYITEKEREALRQKALQDRANAGGAGTPATGG